MKKLANGLIGTALVAAAISTVLAGGAATPVGRYMISSGTVYDTKTQLTWQQIVPSSTYKQAAAVTYCSSLNLNGTKWRLPTTKELATIVDFAVAPPGPTIDATAFPGTPATYFWSSTPDVGPPAGYYVWVVQFAGGSVGDGALLDSYAVRCVR